MLESPFLFLYAELYSVVNNGEIKDAGDSLFGTRVSSLYKLRDLDDSGMGHMFPKLTYLVAGFFIFPDISVRKVGNFCLQYHLLQIGLAILLPILTRLRINSEISLLQSIQSDSFHVLARKGFPGSLESTRLSEHLFVQGVSLKLRPRNVNS